MSEPANDIQGFPSDFSTPEQKQDKQFGIRYGRAIWTLYQNGAGQPNPLREIILKNRKYAEGLQSIDKYKTKLNPEGDTSYMNIDYSPVNIIANRVDNIIGRIVNQDYKYNCTPLDPESKSQEDEKLKEIYTNMYLKQVSDLFEQQTGLPIVPPNAEIPESDEEAELWMALNFKHASAIAMKQALDWVALCTQEKELRTKIIRDIIVAKRAAVKVSHDPNGGVIREYLDVADVITPYSKHDDFRNVKYIAVQRQMTIAELRTQTNDFTTTELENIAKSYAGQNGNPSSWAYGSAITSYSGYYPQSGAPGTISLPYDNFYINVLEFYFLTIDNEVYSEKPRKNGGVYFKKRKSTWMPEEGSKHTVSNKRVQYVYGGNWIINSNYIYGYGKQKNIPREQNNGMFSTSCTLPIVMIAPNIYDGQNKSLVERMIPHEDQLNLLKGKMQQLILKARPPGVAIDGAGLDEVFHGQGKVDEKKVIALYNGEGSLIYRSQREDGTPINNAVITELRNGLPADLNMLIELANHEITQINNVIGYNDAVDGTTPDSSALVGVQKNAILASNNSLRPLNLAYVSLFERVAKQTALMIQDQIEYNYDSFARAIGAFGTDVLKYGKKLAMHQFNIAIEFAPDEAQKAAVMALVQRSIDAGKIETSDALRVSNILEKNAQYAAQMLVVLEKKNMKNRMAETQAAAQANAEQQAMGAQAAAEAEIEKEKALTELRIYETEVVTKIKTDETIRLETVKTDLKMKQVAFEKDVEIETTPPTTTPTT
jgi:hypothetical protein